MMENRCRKRLPTPSRSWLGRVLNTATHHAQHHESNRANFSLYFNHWDRLVGTNHSRYAERFEEAVGQATSFKPANTR